MVEIPEEVLLSDAEVVAQYLVDLVRDRLLAAVTEREAADRRVVAVEKLLADSQELAGQLQKALDSRIAIEQAKGVLAERHQLTLDDAFHAMRAHSRRHRLRLHEVAIGIASGTVNVDP